MNINNDELLDYLYNHEGLSMSFGKYSKLYIMTTENIYEYLNNFNIKNKNILTVIGSGDHVLNSFLLGAK